MISCKKKCVKFIMFLLLLIIFWPANVFANIRCNDGTISPSCSDCHQGCCSHHGGCLRDNNSYYNENSDDYDSEEFDGESDSNNELLYVLGIGGAIAGGYYFGRKRSDK